MWYRGREMGLPRRSFILAGGGALLKAQTAHSYRLTLGVIGSGRRGTFVMTVFQKDPSVKDHPKRYRNYKQLRRRKEAGWSSGLGAMATPAAHHELDPNRFRDWRLYSDYAGGIVTDQDAHVVDGIREP